MRRSVPLDPEHLATLRSALRLYKDAGYGEPDARPDEIHELATAEGELISMDDEGITKLDRHLKHFLDQDYLGSAIFDPSKFLD